jgi:hypothetical protein
MTAPWTGYVAGLLSCTHSAHGEDAGCREMIKTSPQLVAEVRLWHECAIEHLFGSMVMR